MVILCRGFRLGMKIALCITEDSNWHCHLQRVGLTSKWSNPWRANLRWLTSFSLRLPFREPPSFPTSISLNSTNQTKKAKLISSSFTMSLFILSRVYFICWGKIRDGDCYHLLRDGGRHLVYEFFLLKELMPIRVIHTQ